MTQVCAGCGNTYDTTTFGAGAKYCTKQCRYTKGGLKPLGHSTGRPRSFPIISTGERELASTYLMDNGWTLRTTRTTNIRLAARGWFTIKVGFGGGPHERASDAIVWWEGNEIMIKSPCKKGIEHRGEGKMSKRIPCHTAVCKKCSKTRWFKALLENPTNVSKLLAGEGLVEKDEDNENIVAFDARAADSTSSSGEDGPSAA